MNWKKIVPIVAAVLVIVVLALFAFIGSIMFDLGSNFATGTETLVPAGNLTGKALVVYNPGFSGAARDMAVKVADDLKAEGYWVRLTGINSASAAMVSDFDVIVVGGPVYAGNASSSVKTYLLGLRPPAGAKIGVFGSGWTDFPDGDFATVARDVASLPVDSQLDVRAVAKITQRENVSQRCADFVAALLRAEPA